HGLLLALWRRPMRSVYHTPSLPRTGRQVLGQDLKCSELDPEVRTSLGSCRLNDLTQRWSWRGMLSDRRTSQLGGEQHGSTRPDARISSCVGREAQGVRVRTRAEARGV